MAKKLHEILQQTPLLDLDEMVVEEVGSSHVLQEGKWVTNPPGNLRVDQPTHGAGQVHAHVFGRRGDELGIVNIDGSGSHGSKFRLPDHHAEKLRELGFVLAANNVVEWVVIATGVTLLLG